MIDGFDDQSQYQPVCVSCGLQFNAKFPHQLTCSVECRRLHRNRRSVNHNRPSRAQRRIYDRRHDRKQATRGRVFLPAETMTALEERYGSDVASIEAFVDGLVLEALRARTETTG